MRSIVRLASRVVLMMLVAGAALAAEGDVVFKREGTAETGTRPAVFPHWIHRIRYKCYACHPAPYAMKSGGSKISMAAMEQGQFCGVCHNGKTAWPVSIETCNRCHVGE